ncbi:MAG TPA: hypothetical protein PKA99_13265 [Dermatophilaceae bacterium]|jgi:hypothetical protein|nr:hypothetical protein [Dermatophilaceae bacterium]
MFWTTPSNGDWVRVTKELTAPRVGALLTTCRLQKGTRGVVIDDERIGFFSPTIAVRVDRGTHHDDVRVPVRHLSVTRRDGGVTAFVDRTRLIHAARIGVMLAMVLPLVLFLGHYLVVTGTTDGMISALAVAAVDSGMQMLEFLLANPAKAIIFLVVSWLLGVFAFRH